MTPKPSFSCELFVFQINQTEIIVISFLNFFLIMTGSLVIIMRDRLLHFIQESKGYGYSNKQSWFSSVVVMIVVGGLLLSSFEK